MNMNRLLVAALLLSVACLHTPVRDTARVDDAAARDQIASVIGELTTAQKNYDAAALDRLFAADYVEISPVGELDDRARVLSFYTPDKRDPLNGELISYMVEELTTRIYGDTAVAVARLPFTMKMPDGQTTSRAFRCTFVLVRDGSSWKVASAQYTGIRPPA